VGVGIAKLFASAGMKVIITYRTNDHLDQAMEWFKSGRTAQSVHDS
jgi:short-subunit dehydrogenase involved in D-alanine esterification of teichoic acids